MNELDKAARAASEAFGMSVEVAHAVADAWLVEVSASLDDETEGVPIISQEWIRPAALAYLEGLEAGARIANVRHEALVAAARIALDKLDTLTTEEFQRGCDKPAREALTEALAELEG